MAARRWRVQRLAVLEECRGRPLRGRGAARPTPLRQPRHVLVEAHLLRLLAESVYWNVHDSERWTGAPRCGRAFRSENTLAGPCRHEQDHDRTCTERQDDIDDSSRGPGVRHGGGTDRPRHRLAGPVHQPPSLRRRSRRRRRPPDPADAARQAALYRRGASTSSNDSTSRPTFSARPGARRLSWHPQSARPPGTPCSRIPGTACGRRPRVHRPAGNNRWRWHQWSGKCLATKP
jgi:hypothetical protein